VKDSESTKHQLFALWRIPPSICSRFEGFLHQSYLDSIESSLYERLYEWRIKKQQG
jgi:hypothetical protein